MENGVALRNLDVIGRALRNIGALRMDSVDVGRAGTDVDVRLIGSGLALWANWAGWALWTIGTTTSRIARVSTWSC